MKVRKGPFVSVCMLAFNHRHFIADAIEGVLMQQTDFSVELVIGEDLSTDDTRSVCEQYLAGNPNRIRLLNRTRNLGMTANFIETLRECRGKYVAICDGDDYWTNSDKLQRQVDFLETNTDCSISFHRVKLFPSAKDCIEFFPVSKIGSITTFADLARRNYIPTSSCIFRNSILEDLPAWFSHSPLADYPLHLLNASTGNIGFIDETMGVYRTHSGGVWSEKKRLEREKSWIDVIEKCKDHFYPAAQAEFNENLSRALTEYAFLSFEAGNTRDFRSSVRKLFKTGNANGLRTTLSLWIRYLASFFMLGDPSIGTK